MGKIFSPSLPQKILNRIFLAKFLGTREGPDTVKNIVIRR